MERLEYGRSARDETTRDFADPAGVRPPQPSQPPMSSSRRPAPATLWAPPHVAMRCRELHLSPSLRWWGHMVLTLRAAGRRWRPAQTLASRSVLDGGAISARIQRIVLANLWEFAALGLRFCYQRRQALLPTLVLRHFYWRKPGLLPTEVVFATLGARCCCLGWKVLLN